MNISSIKPIPQQHQSKVAIGLLLAVVSVIGFAACSASSSQQGAFPTREEAGVQQQAPADTTVDLEDAEVREYLANAFRSLDAVDQDTVCSAWLVSSPAERFDLYTGIVAGVDGISDAQIDAVFPPYFESVCS